MPKSPWILIAFRFLWEAKPTLAIELFCIIISWLDPDTHNSQCVKWNFWVISIFQHLTKKTQLIELLGYLPSGLKNNKYIKGYRTNYATRLKKINGNISLGELSVYQLAGMNLPQAILSTNSHPIRIPILRLKWERVLCTVRNIFL